MKNNKKDNKNKFINWKYFLFITVIILGLIIFFIYQNEDIKTFSVKEREVIYGFNTNALIIRDEETIHSPISGTLNIIIKEGERTAYGEKIAYIQNDQNKYNIYTNKPGIISYAFDGLEEELRYGKITPQVLNNYSEYEREYKQYIDGNKVQKGEKLYRNINNYKQYLLIKVDQNWKKIFNENETVFIDRSPQNDYSNLIEANIKKIYKQNEEEYLLIQLKTYVKSWNNNRWVDVEIIKNIYRGLAVPSSSVFKTPSGTKVLKYTFDHKISMQDIIVKEETVDWVIVEKLEVGDEIITNPEKVNFGRNAE